MEENIINPEDEMSAEVQKEATEEIGYRVKYRFEEAKKIRDNTNKVIRKQALSELGAVDAVQYETVKQEADRWKEKYAEAIKKHAKDVTAWADRFVELEEIAEKKTKEVKETIIDEMTEQMEEGYQEAYDMLVDERKKSAALERILELKDQKLQLLEGNVPQHPVGYDFETGSGLYLEPPTKLE